MTDTVLGVRANTVLATTGLTWNTLPLGVDGAYGSTPATFAYWFGTTANGVGTIDFGFGTLLSSGLPDGVTVSSAAFSLNNSSHATRIVAAQMELFDGATPIGTPQPLPPNTNVPHVDTVTFNPTLAQLRSPDFKVRITVTRYNGTSGSNYNIDHLDVAVTYAEAPVEPPIEPVEPPTWTPGPGPVGRVTIDGRQIDPCYTLAEVTVLHGRGSFAEQGRPSSATIRVEVPAGPMPTLGESGQIMVLDGTGGTMFSGRIVERSLEHFTDNSGAGWGRFTATAVGPLAALGYRKIGDVPWPQESGVARAAHILAAAGVGFRVEGETDLQVLARDVDSQPAAGLLDELAAWTGAAVFDTPSGQVVYQSLDARTTVRPYRWTDAPDAMTWDDLDPALSWDGDPPTLADWVSPSGAVVLPCDVVAWEPEWTSSESEVINQASVSYGPADPQDVLELADSASIALHNTRYWQQSTQLATLADATALAGHVVTTRAWERWQLAPVTVDLDLLDDTTRAAVLGLVCGDPVVVEGLPQPAPAVDWSGIVEGWTFTQTGQGGTVLAQMSLTLSDPLLSLVVPAWEDYSGVYEWQQHPADWTWDHMDKIPA